ncbi:MAG: DUF6273 domain-containing protein [Dysosmobacter welbionis]|uniref:DUF6273 domain-containing protein n=1 Tax=Dysosmobacter welbionis TaxID=2093857 RepID=UPI00399B79EE
MAQQLGQVAVGTLVKLNENGSPVEFYVAKHDYESGLNGAGRTLLVRKECYDNRVWNNVQVNTYASSALDSWLNSDYKNLLDSDFLTVIGTTKFQYTIGYGDKTLSTLERAIFQLSRTELGFTLPADANFEGNILPIASILQKAFLNGETNSQWTRTPNTSYLTAAFFVYAGGNSDSTGVTAEAGSRPAFTVPSTLSVTDDGTLSLASAPPHAITVPVQAMQGNQLAVSWPAVDGADGYILERKANTDADWVQVYSGADFTFSETAGTWESVQYRVKSGANGKYGKYTISSLVDVVPVSILVISGSDGSLGTLTNDVQYVVSSSGTSALTVTESAGRTTRTFTATNGATIRIPVMDLPTGTGTIKITASTNPGSGVVTVTRNWTYSKTAPTFANAGSTAQLQQNGKNVFPLTLLECVRGGENLAPGGYGLGTPAQLRASANDCKLSGWYMTAFNVPNAPDGDGGYWLIRVDGRDDTVLYQTAYANRQNSGVPNSVICRRYYVNSEWSPWEYITPPMQLGVEYRTTERYNSKPVYAKAVNFGALPANSSKSVAHGISDMARCFEVVGSYGVQNLVGEAAVTTIGANTENIMIATDRNLSAETAIVLMKYTKTTD